MTAVAAQPWAGCRDGNGAWAPGGALSDVSMTLPAVRKRFIHRLAAWIGCRFDDGRRQRIASCRGNKSYIL